MKQRIVYQGWERPLIAVLIDRTWYPGELRMWTQHDDDTWTADVSYTDEHHMNHLTSVASDQVRPVEEH
ncbi:hypothetical protein [Nocardioides sp. LHG3406-4]|uniref:hypothetical protein n=1 Tax=Nocardioides sp. LHG3406-4 TaxID=2804575 RepID=UPI003CF2AE0C